MVSEGVWGEVIWCRCVCAVRAVDTAGLRGVARGGGWAIHARTEQPHTRSEQVAREMDSCAGLHEPPPDESMLQDLLADLGPKPAGAAQLTQLQPTMNGLDPMLHLGDSDGDELPHFWHHMIPDVDHSENNTILAASVPESSGSSVSSFSWDVDPNYLHYEESSSSRSDDVDGNAGGSISRATEMIDSDFHLMYSESGDGLSESSGLDSECEWSGEAGVFDPTNAYPSRDSTSSSSGELDPNLITVPAVAYPHDELRDEAQHARAQAGSANGDQHKLLELPVGTCLKDEWSHAIELLRRRNSTSFRRRPAYTAVSVTKQIFVEPRHHRRGAGQDRWRTAGKNAGVDRWIDEQHGVRRRHGRLERTCGDNGRFHHYSLLYRPSEKSRDVTENGEARVYILRESTHEEVQAWEERRSQTLDLSISVLADAFRSFPRQLPEEKHVSEEKYVPHAQASVAGVPTIDLRCTNKSLASVAAGAAGPGRTGLITSTGKRTTAEGVGEGAHTTNKRSKRRRTAQGTAMLSGLSVVAMVVVGYLQYVRTPDSTGLDKQCDDGFFMPPSSFLGHCVPCQSCLLRGLRVVLPCTPTSDTVCSPWGWEHGAVRATPPRPDAYEDSTVPPRLHFPQFASSWVLGSSVYTFGGSSGTTQLNMSEKRSMAGERCTTQAIGVSDELWRFTKQSGWVQLLPGQNKSSMSGPRQQPLWPRRRYAATSWTANNSGAILFGGAFELCLQADYALHGDLSLTGSYLVSPDSLYWLENQSDWVLLGGSDRWRTIRDDEIGSVMSDGLMPMSDGTAHQSAPCTKANRLCSWPLPRAHAQGWMLNGVAYLFSGIFTIFEGGFDDLTATQMLLNDLWQIYPSSGGTWTEAKVEASRVAGCFGLIEDLLVLPPDTPSSTSYPGLVAGPRYPGPRYQAATWVLPASLAARTHASSSDDEDPKPKFVASGVSDVGWLFGGIGRRASVSALTSTAGTMVGACQVMEDTVHIARVTNLCDLWSFAPGRGFHLVAACEADMKELSVAGMQPSSVVAMADGPTAGVFATAFVVPRRSASGTHPEAELWMFGGVTSCAPFNGVDQDGNVVDEWTTRRQGTALANLSLTMCDMNLPGQTEGEIDAGKETEPIQDYVGVVGFADGHPDQPCSADLWQFSISEGRWHRAEQPEPSHLAGQSLWPDARCGASVITELGSIIDQPNVSIPPLGSLPRRILSTPQDFAVPTSPQLLVQTAETPTTFIAIIGGWGESSGGECEEWPSCNADARHSCPFKSYLSEALDNTDEARSSRQRAARCVEMSDAWQLSVAIDKN